MEEVIAKTKRSLYIGAYSGYGVAGVLFMVIGAFLAISVGSQEFEAAICGWILLGAGAVLVVASICYLIYFLKMPKTAIIFKDGKLRFMNGVECAPSEVDNWQAKSGGVDGSFFNFGKLIVVIKGQSYKFKYIENVQYVISRLYTLKIEDSMKAEIAKRNEAEAVKEEKTEISENAEN